MDKDRVKYRIELNSQLFNKLAKLRKHASKVHFVSNSFGPIPFVLEFDLDGHS